MNNQYLISGICLVFGIAILGMGANATMETYQDTQTHESTEATVVTSVVEKGGSVSDRVYYPVVEYEYEVDGESYANDRIYHESQSGVVHGDAPPGTEEFDQRSGAEKLSDRFSEGETVTVHYDPGNPSASYLVEPSVGLQAGGALVFGLVVIGTGIAGFMGRIDFS